jgi:hypothetical protein
MSDDVPAWIRCPGPPSSRMRFYRALARCLAAYDGPSGIVFESTLPDPVPRTLVRPAPLADPLFAEPAFAAIPLVRDPVPPPSTPAPGQRGRLAALIPRRGVGDPSLASGVRDPPVARTLVGDGGWLSIQTLWSRGVDGRIWVARRAWLAEPSTESLDARFAGVAGSVADGWASSLGTFVSARRLGLGARRDWVRASAGALPRAAWIAVPPARLEGTAEPGWAPDEPFEPAREGHGIVLGASGAGKSWLLADRAARAIRRGEPVLAIDLHGDLAPSICARLAPPDRVRVVGVDLADRPAPGISALPPGAAPERAAAHLVAALKRLSADGSEIHWGFRLERILDTFVRLVQESGGTLLDLYALLTDRDRRDAARLATGRTDLARFLEELGPIVSRTPDFLWAATARLSKVALDPALAELLAPPDGGLPVEELLAAGRSILLRIPFALVGPEAAAFAGTIVLARVYLSLAARGDGTGGGAPVLFVLDEVQGFSPRLVAEILAEGRKFGVRLLLATQYPDRLSAELRPAAAGVVRDIVSFRVPPPSAPLVGSWLGLAPGDAERWLVPLAPGYGFARDPERSELRALVPGPDPPSAISRAWPELVEATRQQFLPERPTPTTGAETDAETERLLLAILASEEERRPLAASELVGRTLWFPGPSVDAAVLADRASCLERRGLIRSEMDGLHLTPAGERRLGLGAPTGATRESAEHRALLTAAFRLFARRGAVLEIVRQGRWDTTLPDALLRQLPGRPGHGSPAELGEAIDRARRGWAWRFFGGRDVHVEAEVSGALRPERVRHGVRKALRQNGYVLFLVADPHRAARIKATLHALGVDRSRGQVWTLRSALAARVPASPGGGLAGRR